MGKRSFIQKEDVVEGAWSIPVAMATVNEDLSSEARGWIHDVDIHLYGKWWCNVEAMLTVLLADFLMEVRRSLSASEGGGCALVSF